MDWSWTIDHLEAVPHAVNMQRVYKRYRFISMTENQTIVRPSIRISKSLCRQAKTLAEDRGMTLSQLVEERLREILAAALKETEKK